MRNEFEIRLLRDNYDLNEIASGWFHKRMDLTPNICAVYVEEDYRNKGMAKKC